MDLSPLSPDPWIGLGQLTWANVVIIAAALALMYLAIFRGIEPLLLLPIGFGCLQANSPAGGMTTAQGMMAALYRVGVLTELFPLLIFLGVGAMIDFTPLPAQPRNVLLGAAGQFGIFGVRLLATLLGFPLNQAASIGVIGAIDGPTSIFVATQLAPELLAPIAVETYSRMSLIPIIQPPPMRAMTTPSERLVRMDYAPRAISNRTLIIFPLAIVLLVGLIVPAALPLISMLMLGNLLRVSGVVDRLSKAAQNEIINIATLFLVLAIGATMSAETFLTWDTYRQDHAAGAAGFRPGHCRGSWFRQAHVRGDRWKSQSTDRRLGRLGFPSGGAACRAGDDRRGSRPFHPDACHGGEHPRQLASA